MNVLIVSDIHGNLTALKTVLENSKGWSDIWVLGDLVDYGPEPHLVVDLIKDLEPSIIVMGNHDYAVAYNVDCRCGEEIHELSVYTRMNISFKLLSKEQIDWLKKLRMSADTNLSGRRAYIVHGSPSDPLYGYMKPSLPHDVLLNMLSLKQSKYSLSSKTVNADVIIAGHTHIPMKIMVYNTVVFNPGSVGQPRDGDPRASYGLLDPDSFEFKVIRVKYDIDSVVSKLKCLNLEWRYLSWLERILRQGSTYIGQ
ncbi:MAG: metallophosphoesterase family protein [Desulfurococcaceae archaeon]